MKKYLSLILILVCSLIKAQDLSLGLQAHFTFDGDLLDYSGNAYHLQNGIGSITYNVVSGTDQSVVFDGFNRLDQMGSFDNSTWTSSAVSLWVKSSTINSIDQTLIQGAYMGFAVLIGDNNGHIGGFFQSSSSTAYYNSSNIADGNWHHILYQTNGSTIFLYVDGVYIGSQSHTLVTGNGGGNNKLYFGQSIIFPRPFTGELNECRIYDRMLTECEIQVLAGLNPDVFEEEFIEESCENYYWSISGEEYTASGIYYDTISTSDGCDSVYILDLTINNLDTGVTVTNNELISNESGIGITYQWINCEEDNIVGNTQTYTPTHSGSFAVIVSDGACQDTSSCYRIKQIGINEIEKSDFEILYTSHPNQIHVHVSTFHKGDVIILRDILGRLLLKNEIEDYVNPIVLPNSNGILTIEIHSSNGRVNAKKIIK